MIAETTADTLQAALAAAARGWRVFPVVPGRDRSGKVSWKKPVVSAWQLVSTTDPDTIRGWWARFKHIRGYGWHTQGFAAIDFDIPNGEKLLNDSGLDTPPTLTVRSGNTREPWHYTLVYRLPPGRRLRVTALADFKALPGREKFRGIDIRSSGGMIVGPGSYHATGGRYTWDGRAAAPAPDWLLALTEDEKARYTAVLTPAEAAARRKAGRHPDAQMSGGRDGPIPPMDSDAELTDYLVAKYPVDTPGVRNQRQLLAVAWLLLVKRVPAQRVLRLVINWLTHYAGSYTTDLTAATGEAADMVRRTLGKMAGGDLVPSPDHQRLTADSREHDESINRFMLSCSLQGVEVLFAEAVLLHCYYHRGEVERGGTLPLTDRQIIRVVEYRHGRTLSWNLFYRLKRDFVTHMSEGGAVRPARKRELLRTLARGTHGVPSRYAVSAEVLRALGREPPCDGVVGNYSIARGPEDPFWEDPDAYPAWEDRYAAWTPAEAQAEALRAWEGRSGPSPSGKVKADVE